MNSETLVLALGGNAIVGGSRTFESQFRAVSVATRGIARLVSRGYRIVITHGNGPQVGDSLVRHQFARQLVPAFPLYACVAETQGLIGSMIQSALFHHLGASDGVISMISMAYVSGSDPAFKNPTKPIGPAYRKRELDEVRKMAPDAVFVQLSPDRYRRVVASPAPVGMAGMKVLKDLLFGGHVVIAAGGGGIPVAKNGKKTMFVDAVIDKDLSSEMIATDIGAAKLVFLTDVEGAYLDFSRRKKLLRKVSASEMKGFLLRNEFEAGSMEPKVSAAVRFVEKTGGSAIICRLTKLGQALEGKAGTIISK